LPFFNSRDDPSYLLGRVDDFLKKKLSPKKGDGKKGTVLFFSHD
jgi:hypothetical protein